MKLDIQMFADGKIVIDTLLNTSNFEKGLDEMKKQTNRAGDSIKNIVTGLRIDKIISAAMGQITSSIGGAVARTDTLNNFTKVMSNLGIEAEAADASLKKMSKGLDGLPTTLNEGAMAVQRFASANGDIEKSTDIFLALNNAILAGGASSEIQSSALEQLSQAYAKGKPDMMEWRTALTAMPAQLKQVANAMGYVSSADLGEALREQGGEEEFQRFIDTVILLNEKGADGFESFQVQAKNSIGGIGTSITNAKTQVVKGVASIIDSLNAGLQDAGLPNIAEIITTIGKKSKEVLDFVASTLPPIINIIKEMIPYLTAIGVTILAWKIGTVIQGMITGFQAAKLAIALFTLETNGASVAQAVMNGTLKLTEGLVALLTGKMTLAQLAQAGMAKAQALLNAVMSANPIGLIIAAIVALVAVFVLLWNKSEAFRNFWIGLWNGIVNFFKGAVKLIVNVFSTIINFMVNIGTNIVRGIWSGISNGFTWIKNKIKGWVGNVLGFIKKLFGIKSPSTVMRDEVGKYLAQGMGVGFDDELDNVYKDMQKAIDIEQSKLQANVETGRVFNTLQNSTPVVMNLNADIEMDSQKVGRLVTPTITRTIKNGGGV